MAGTGSPEDPGGTPPGAGDGGPADDPGPVQTAREIALRGVRTTADDIALLSAMTREILCDELSLAKARVLTKQASERSRKTQQELEYNAGYPIDYGRHRDV